MVGDLALAKSKEDGRRQDAEFQLEGGGRVKISRRSGLIYSLDLSTDVGFLTITPVSDRRVRVGITPGQRIRETEFDDVELIIEADLP